ncbi:MAG: beta-ketoacyl-[acyl-carrier-protein] synthase family protein [Planctomycetaceae bacterium]|jgi:3-oxoacyl-[acyl-carrier-protein] synthase II|nr:beta-ketoacyl-[acyl-carrier-protein] synthase family protein [Planctomycetaceae bacterium]
MLHKEIVITGMGVLSPIGNDLETYWNSLCEGRSGIGVVKTFESERAPLWGGVTPDVRARDYVKPRKNIKNMSRDIQLGYIAAIHALEHAEMTVNSENPSVPPERLGVVFGSDLIGLELDELVDAFRVCRVEDKIEFSRWGTEALPKIFPLWMLKYLPNLVAGQMAIAFDARGPNNTITLRRCSGLAAVSEAARTIERGQADAMICGGTGNRMNPLFLARSKTHNLVSTANGNAASHPRPYDADRRGTVLSEGAAALIIESRETADARGAKPFARILGFASTFESAVYQKPFSGRAIRQAIRQAMRDANCEPEELSHVNSDGLGGVWEDRVEAEAIRDELGDVPVTSPKGNFGDSGSGSGTIELIASLIGLQKELIPPTLNCDNIDKSCPIRIVRGLPQSCQKTKVLSLNHTRSGRSVAVVIEKT